jgi:hypothetical protein
MKKVLPGAANVAVVKVPPVRSSRLDLVSMSPAVLEALLAVVALMAWARERSIDHFIASVSPDNEPSLVLIRKLGFVQTGDQWDDEDGLELVFELDSG